MFFCLIIAYLQIKRCDIGTYPEVSLAIFGNASNGVHVYCNTVLIGKGVVNDAFACVRLIAGKTRKNPMVVAKPYPSTTIYQHLRHISQAKPIGHEPFLMSAFHLFATRKGKQRLAPRLTIGEPKVALSVKINSVYDDIIVI